MKKLSKKLKKLIARQILALMLILAALVSPASMYLENVGMKTSVTAYASGYQSWLDSWDTGDTYDGINSFVTDENPDSENNALDWLGDTLEAVISILIKNFVGSLLVLLTDSMGMTLENIVYGPILGSGAKNWFQFSLKDGNIWGVGGSLLYAVLRNFMFAVFAIQFMWILATYLVKGTGKGKADLKDMIYNYVFMFSLLYAMPIIVDIVTFIRDVLLRGFLKLTNSLSGQYAMGITDLMLLQSEDDFTIAGAIILCFTLGASFMFAFDYIKRAIQQVYLFGVFPIVAFRSFSDKGILNKWIGHFITSLFVPVLDCIGLWLVYLIQTFNGGLASTQGPAVLGLLVFMSIIPCRNMVAQLFGMPVGGGGFGLMAAAAMAMRALNRPKGGRDNGGLENKANKKPELGDGSSGEGKTIGGALGTSASNTKELPSADGGGIGSGIGETAGGSVDPGVSAQGDGGHVSTVATVDSLNADGSVDSTNHYYSDGGSSHVDNTYDAIGNHSGRETNNYDSEGNITGGDKASWSYDSNGSMTSASKVTYDSEGNITGRSETTYERDDSGRLMAAVKKNYDESGNYIGGQTTTNTYDAEGNTTGTTVSRYGADGSITDSTTNQFDAEGNVTGASEWSEKTNDDGTITQTETKYDPQTGLPASTTETEYAPDSEFAKSVTQTQYDSSGNPISMSKAEYGDNNQIKQQTDTAFDNGRPIGSSTTTFDEQGNKIGTTMNSAADMSVTDKFKDKTRERLDNFKNAFVAPTTTVTDMNGNERKVQDQDAIKKQIALADRKLIGYAHKSDGTIDWKGTAEQVTNGPVGSVAIGAAKATVAGAAISAAAIGGPQAMMAAGMAAGMAMGGKGTSGGHSSEQKPTDDQKPTENKKKNTETERKEDKTKITGAAMSRTAPRKKELSRQAKAAENIKNRFDT